MKDNNHKNFGECVYCGQKASLTSDHIPPKNLFPKPRPSNLITVPACHNCNQSASKDDEYLRLMLVMREDVFEQPAAADIWKKTFKGLKRPESLTFTKNILKSISRKPAYTDSGIFNGNKASYNVDFSRLDAVVERIIRGLFYHHSGYRLPETHLPKSFAVEGLTDPKFWLDPQMRKPIELAASQPTNILGNSVFGYKFIRLGDDIDASIWLMSFYLKVFFVGFTYKPISS